MATWEILEGDCIYNMESLTSNSVDAIVTDPPAGISFMDNDWDANRGGRNNWILWMADVAKECLRLVKPGGSALVWALPRTSHWTATAWEDAGFEVRDCVYHIHGNGFPKGKHHLKPAVECWWLFRKPLSEKTLAQNALKHGTGELNVEKCKIGADKRWPATLIHDGSNEVTKHFPQSTSGTPPTKREGLGYHGAKGQKRLVPPRKGASGSASRFFYCAKPSKKERGATNTHPTVKALKLMEYLCRLITPKNGVILDPFCGSGSTGVAAVNEGFDFIGIELNPEYVDLAHERIEKG